MTKVGTPRAAYEAMVVVVLTLSRQSSVVQTGSDGSTHVQVVGSSDALQSGPPSVASTMTSVRARDTRGTSRSPTSWIAALVGVPPFGSVLVKSASTSPAWPSPGARSSEELMLHGWSTVPWKRSGNA